LYSDASSRNNPGVEDIVRLHELHARHEREAGRRPALMPPKGERVGYAQNTRTWSELTRTCNEGSDMMGA
jgi:hypothetical protein